MPYPGTVCAQVKADRAKLEAELSEVREELFKRWGTIRSFFMYYSMLGGVGGERRRAWTPHACMRACPHHIHAWSNGCARALRRVAVPHRSQYTHALCVHALCRCMQTPTASCRCPTASGWRSATRRASSASSAAAWRRTSRQAPCREWHRNTHAYMHRACAMRARMRVGVGAGNPSASVAARLLCAGANPIPNPRQRPLLTSRLGFASVLDTLLPRPLCHAMQTIFIAVNFEEEQNQTAESQANDDDAMMRYGGASIHCTTAACGCACVCMYGCGRYAGRRIMHSVHAQASESPMPPQRRSAGGQMCLRISTRAAACMHGAKHLATRSSVRPCVPALQV